MHLLIWARRVVVCAAFSGLFLCAADPARAADTAITGTVRSASGAAVPGATVTAKGPAHESTTTDGAGAFTLTLPPGLYQVTVTKPGYATVSTPDVVVLAGHSPALTVTIAELNLSTLREIGHMFASGGRVAMNTGAANQDVIDRAAFSELGDPQINDVIGRIPDVVVEQLGTQKDTAIVVGGLQPYETQVLIDGHPIALGQYGVWLSQYFPSYVLGSVETQSGPGNTTPFADIAVAGTANLQTIAFTKKQTANFTIGTDNWGSQYTDASVTGSHGKLDYVAALGTQGENGYYFGKNECDIYTADPNTQVNSPDSAGVVAFCGSFNGSLYTRGQLYKLRYDFTPTTSFDVGFLGSYGGYSPQGSAWGASDGPTLVEQCIPNTVANPVTPGAQRCTNPADANLIGKTINGFYWFPGTQIWNTQELWDGQFRTTLGATTVLVRPYLGSIQPETYDGTGEGQYPAFFGPPPGAAGYQTPSPSIPIASPNPFESSNGPCPVGNVDSFVQINSPSNTITSTNGQEECYQYPYKTYEIDKLYGSTFSFVRPIGSGDDFLDFTYDFHGQSTFAYANAPTNVQVPFSSTRFSTFSLTGRVTPIDKLALNYGLYNTDWTVVGEQPAFNSAGTPTGTTGLDRTVSRFDPHLAFVYRADANTSIRASTGTSETFPFVGDVSGPPAYQPAAFGVFTDGLLTEKNANLKPEYSIAYDLGADHRFNRSSDLSLDLQDTIVHDVFQQLETQETVPAGVLGIYTPINVARLAAKLVTLKYVHAPVRGLGYNVALTADSSILNGIPASAYNGTTVFTPGLPANGAQVCGNGAFTPGLATCIPYLKGYGQFTYTFRSETFAALGFDYEGKNNAYYQPPFAIVDFEYKKPVTKLLDFNLSVQNLLNTNSYDYLPALNLGVPAVADYLATDGTIQQSSYSTYRIPAPTRTLRVSLDAHIGQ
jgi:hypothetical protein